MFRYVINDSDRNKRKKKKNKKRSNYEKFKSKISRRVNRSGCSLAEAVYEAGREGAIKGNSLPIGIPQGSPMSGLLANIYMSGFDSEFVKMFPDILYRRYSDDIAVVCETAEAENVLSWLNNSIKKYALNINPSKVFIATFVNESGVLRCSDMRDGNGEKLERQYIDYLGFEFSGCNVRVCGKTLRNAYRKADKKIKKFLLRQIKNPRKKHDVIKGDKRRGSNMYIKNACNTMINVGCGILSQKNRLFGFIRKKRTSKLNKKA